MFNPKEIKVFLRENKVRLIAISKYKVQKSKAKRIINTVVLGGTGVLRN